MTEESNHSVRLQHLEDDVKEIKADNKELKKSMDVINSNHLETKWLIKRIEEGQVAMSTGFLNLQKSMETIAAKPVKDYEKLKWIVLSTLIALHASTAVGSIKIIVFPAK